MPHIYGQFAHIFMKVTCYDRIKNCIMPQSASRYSGLDLMLRSQMAALACMCLTMPFTYPLDLLHTRMAADYTPQTRKRIYVSTF